MTEAADQIETENDALGSGQTHVQIWLKKIKLAQEEMKDWEEEAEKAIEIYEADDAKTSFNIFHSNIEVLVPALYNSSPIPDVRRRYGDPDPIAKLVVDMTERALSYTIDQYDFDGIMLMCIKDACVPGRGQARVRYEPQMVTQQHPQTQAPVEVKGYEKVACERVPWDKWGHGPGRSWADVPFVWFEHDLTRDELIALSPDVGKTAPLADDESDDEDEKEVEEKGIMQTACVYEIWDRTAKSVIFITPGNKNKPLRVEPDPLGLEGFFPCPSPIEQISRISSLVPICPYIVYRPLIEELDVVTKRIRKLVGQLKVRGLVDGALAADLEGLRTLDDGQYMSATDATAYTTGGGGLEKGIAHMPLDPTVKALQQLYVQRDQIKQTIYEVTGLSDILRGATNPNETLGAQQLKAQSGSMRMQRLQAGIARFARDLFRMKVEIMARHFEPQNLATMTNLPDQSKPDQVQAWPLALQMFKSDTRSFRIDIETDSTIRADQARSQEQMNLFLAGTGQFAAAMTGVVQLAPEMLPVITEVYTAFARKFKLGKQAEDALDGLAQMAPQMAEQAKQKSQNNPESQKAQLEMQKMQQSAQIEGQKAQSQMQVEQAKLAIIDKTKTMELQYKAQENAQSLQMEREKADMAMQLEERKFQHQMQLEEMKFHADQRRADAEHSNKLQIATDQAQQKTQAAETLNTVKAGSDKGSAQVAALADGMRGAVDQLGQHIAAQTKAHSAATEQTLKIATAKRRLIKNPDGSKETEIVL